MVTHLQSCLAAWVLFLPPSVAEQAEGSLHLLGSNMDAMQVYFWFILDLDKKHLLHTRWWVMSQYFFCRQVPPVAVNVIANTKSLHTYSGLVFRQLDIWDHLN